MEKLKKHIHDDSNGLDYVLVGDYYIPDLQLPEESRPIGRWGRMHREYLQEYCPDRYNMLLNLRDAVKRYHYMLSHTNLINGLSMNATVESIMPWWQIALYAIDVVFALLMVGSLFMMFRAKRRSEEKA